LLSCLLYCLLPCLLYRLMYCLLYRQGPRMVRDVFRLAKENAPSIIFIDEVDAIATARFDAQTGGVWCSGADTVLF
jgi:hypothetical protein